MKTLRQTAKEYETPKTRNICELDKIPIDLDIEVVEFERKNPKEGEDPNFRVNQITIEDNKYRVPTSVIEQLKKHLDNNPTLGFFKVVKDGEGMNTRYTVIPLSD